MAGGERGLLGPEAGAMVLSRWRVLQRLVAFLLQMTGGRAGRAGSRGGGGGGERLRSILTGPTHCRWVPSHGGHTHPCRAGVHPLRRVPSAGSRAPCGTCSSPPGRAAARCAAGDGHAATAAAPVPSAATQPTARAWPAAGELPTSGQRGRLAGPGMEQLWAGRAGAT